MKLLDCSYAPSPRRVRMFLAEKGLEPERIQVDLAAGEQFSASFRSVNARCMVPVLVLDDGTPIAEVFAIWSYLEAVRPNPPLLGGSPLQKALVTMWDRRMELDGYLPAAEALRNEAPAFMGHAVAGPHDHEQVPALVARGRARVLNFYADLEARLAQSPYVAGDAFSAADITAFVTLEFAVNDVKVALAPQHTAVERWWRDILKRPSAAA